MKFSNSHLQNLAEGKSQNLSAREGVDFFLSKRDEDIATWDPRKASMVFTSDEAIINCKMLQIDVDTTQNEILSQFVGVQLEGEQG
jgi:hypothetical protein